MIGSTPVPAGEPAPGSCAWAKPIAGAARATAANDANVIFFIVLFYQTKRPLFNPVVEISFIRLLTNVKKIRLVFLSIIAILTRVLCEMLCVVDFHYRVKRRGRSPNP